MKQIYILKFGALYQLFILLHAINDCSANVKRMKGHSQEASIHDKNKNGSSKWLSLQNTKFFKRIRLPESVGVILAIVVLNYSIALRFYHHSLFNIQILKYSA